MRRMGWFTSKEHPTKGDDKYKETLGPTHTDVYHVNDAGKRDQSHNTDFKISGPKIEQSNVVRDVLPKK